jgi:hypothetical protein
VALKWDILKHHKYDGLSSMMLDHYVRKTFNEREGGGLRF